MQSAMMAYIDVQCILDCLPVSVSTEPVYSDDQFAHSYSNPYKLNINVSNIYLSLSYSLFSLKISNTYMYVMWPAFILLHRRYLKEYALMLKPHTLFLSLDDKAKISIGEPDFPIAAVTRGKQVSCHFLMTQEMVDHTCTLLFYRHL